MFDIVDVGDEVWHALSDPTRRAILDTLAQGPRTTADLAEQFPVTRSAVTKHLTALEQSSLVLVRRQGKYRYNHLNPVPLKTIADRWTTNLSSAWTDRLARLAEAAERRYEQLTQPKARRIHLELERTILAPPPVVFDALTQNASDWWVEPYFQGPALKIVLEARVGGMLYEDWGAGNGLHLCTVTRIERPLHVTLAGGMGMGGLVNGTIDIRIDPHPHGSSVQLSHIAVGELPEGVEHNYRDGWEQLIGTQLKAFVERDLEEDHVQQH